MLRNFEFADSILTAGVSSLQTEIMGLRWPFMFFGDDVIKRKINDSFTLSDAAVLTAIVCSLDD